MRHASANDIPVYSLMLSAHLLCCVLCLPLFLLPSKVPWRISFGMSAALVWPYHLSCLSFTTVSKFVYGLILLPTISFTRSFVTCSIYEMSSMLWKYLIFVACILFLVPMLRSRFHRLRKR